MTLIFYEKRIAYVLSPKVLRPPEHHIILTSGWLVHFVHCLVHLDSLRTMFSLQISTDVSTNPLFLCCPCPSWCLHPLVDRGTSRKPSLLSSHPLLFLDTLCLSPPFFSVCLSFENSNFHGYYPPSSFLCYAFCHKNTGSNFQAFPLGSLLEKDGVLPVTPRNLPLALWA